MPGSTRNHVRRNGTRKASDAQCRGSLESNSPATGCAPTENTHCRLFCVSRERRRKIETQKVRGRVRERQRHNLERERERESDGARERERKSATEVVEGADHVVKLAVFTAAPSVTWLCFDRELGPLRREENLWLRYLVVEHGAVNTFEGSIRKAVSPRRVTSAEIQDRYFSDLPSSMILPPISHRSFRRRPQDRPYTRSTCSK